MPHDYGEILLFFFKVSLFLGKENEFFEFAGCFLKTLPTTILFRIGVFALIVGGRRSFG
jgi:hypothetical protein